MVIANAIGAQVAKAIAAVATLSDVPQSEVQTYRRGRLEALLKLPEFGGNKSALGRELGYRDGAYVRQLLEGERPITEKLVGTIEALKAGKYKGWFDRSPASEAPPEASYWVRKLIELGPSLTEPQQAQLLSLALQAVSNSGQLLNLILVPNAQASAPIELPPPGG